MIKTCNSFDDGDDVIDIKDFFLTNFVKELGEYKTSLAFKGGYILNRLLEDTGRLTKDIDASIREDLDYDSIIVPALKKVKEKLIKNNYCTDVIIGSITNGKSKLFECKDINNKIVFSVDFNYHDIDFGTTNHSINSDTEVLIFSPERMLGDKLSALNSRVRFRRAKDLYDFYRIITTFDINKSLLNTCLVKREVHDLLGVESPFSDENRSKMLHAYTVLDVIDYRTLTNIETMDFELVDKLYVKFCSGFYKKGSEVWSHGIEQWV